MVDYRLDVLRAAVQITQISKVTQRCMQVSRIQVIAKLYASRPNDKEDLIAVAPFVNWEILEYLALDDNEAKKSALNERNYLDFLYDYREYKERYRL